MSNQTEPAPTTLTRQQIYDRIRETSKDEHILSEMIRLGYWKEDVDKPSLPKQLIEEESKLQQRLNILLKKQNLINDPESALKILHKERKKKALEKRELNKKLKNQQRHERAVAWHEAKQKDVMFLGNDTAIGLRNDETNQQRLDNYGLPNFATGEELATAMGISINELRFLSYDRKTAKINHYQQFLIAKKTGGVRRISAPMPRMKRLQYWILGNVLSKVPLHDVAHGFVPERSIVTNATPHVGKSLVINMDLENFFPTISYRRIKGLFVNLGYSEKIATVFALLCSEAERDEVVLDGDTFHTARSERYLPQGAPTSPTISNLLCRNLDRRIEGMVKKLNFNYTRYADDLTFSYNGSGQGSGQGDDEAPVTKLMWRVRQIIKDEGFIIHPDKTRLMRKHKRQEVTGIVVNDKLSINRADVKRFRALLFQIDKDGIEGKSWGQGELFYAITGYANYIHMVDPVKGQVFKDKVKALKAKYQDQEKQGNQTSEQYQLSELSINRFKQKAVAGEAPKADFWQAEAPEQASIEKTAKELEVERKAHRQAKVEEGRAKAKAESNVDNDNTNTQENNATANEQANTDRRSTSVRSSFSSWIRSLVDSGKDD